MLPRHDRLVRIARGTAHDRRAALADAEGQGWEDVGDEIEEQNLERPDRQGRIGDRGKGDDHDLADVAGEQVEHKLADVLKDDSSLPDGDDDGGKGIVGEDHIGGFACNLGAALTHGDADVGLFQGGGVVHAVAGHRDDGTRILMCGEQIHLLFRADTGKDAGTEEAPPLLLGELVQVLQVAPMDHLSLLVLREPYGEGHAPDRSGLVAGDHHDVDTGVAGGL